MTLHNLSELAPVILYVSQFWQLGLCPGLGGITCPERFCVRMAGFQAWVVWGLRGGALVQSQSQPAMVRPP